MISLLEAVLFFVLLALSGFSIPLVKGLLAKLGFSKLVVVGVAVPVKMASTYALKHHYGYSVSDIIPKPISQTEMVGLVRVAAIIPAGNS